MKQGIHSGVMSLICMCLALFVSCSSCATGPQPSKSASSVPTGATPPTVIPATAPLAKLDNAPFVVPYFPPPDRVDLCGEPAPLHLQEVLERFDREFTIIVYNHAQVYLWLKRMERYFPWIEEKLRHYNLPEDLKYVAIAESDLLPNAYSPKGAAGPWQFIPSTGERYGLDQQGSCDQRYDFERSTESAFRYLNDLNRQFRNWTLAIAAYNCGEKRVQDAIQTQRTSDYYHLKLPLETERYILRILAIKAVLSNPAHYGYNLPKGLGYPELRLDRVNASFSRPVSIASVAGAAGISFREFKRLNPIFRADEIPAGSFELKFPEGTGKTFEQNYESIKVQTASTDYRETIETEKVCDPKPEPARMASKKPAPVTHTVKKGETLSGIAQRYNVRPQSLQQANQLRKPTVLVGQQLKIPRD